MSNYSTLLSLKKLALCYAVMIAIGSTSQIAYGQRKEEPTLSRLRTFVNHEISQSKASGVSVAIYFKGQTWIENFGKTNSANNQDVNDSTLFMSASTAKVLVNVALLRLENQGLLSLNDPIGKYVAGLNSSIHSLKIVDLIGHTSGLEDFTSNFGNSGESKQIQFAQNLDRSDFYTEPGAAFSYSNPAYSMLGALVESITSKNFETAMRELVFDPVGMKSSSYRPDLVDKSKVAWPSSNSSRLPDNAEERASGSLVTTSNDMLKLLVWIMDKENPIRGKILSTLVDKDLTQSFFSYGYGLFKSQRCASTTYWHTGGMPGYKANILFQPENEFAMVILSSGSSLNREQIQNIGIEDMVGTSCDRPNSTNEVTDFTEDEIDKLTGKYHQKIGRRIELRNKGGKLVARMDGRAYETKKTKEGKLVLMQNNRPHITFGIRNDIKGKAKYLVYWVRSYPRVD